ncbi:MAG TPA: hypothetical protein VL123_05655 [Candidatus Udaeobacter sp.]|jgi:hypothetical protein|nr:hypothetical protein [Candidatus Udaeobacter sp.]
MKRSLSRFRQAAPLLAPLLVALLLGVVVVGSTHHHGQLDGHHPCAVCNAAHAPAVAAGAAPTLSHGAALAHTVATPSLEPRAHAAIRGIASRAPPSA